MNNLLDKQAAMRDKIEALASRFLQRCCNDLLAGRQLLLRLREGDCGAFKELEQLAHRIVGTGASLGFESLRPHAVAVERLAESQPHSGTPDPEVITRITEFYARLESEIDLLVRARR